VAAIAMVGAGCAKKKVAAAGASRGRCRTVTARAAASPRQHPCAGSRPRRAAAAYA
jgi:hypothetical protein